MWSLAAALVVAVALLIYWRVMRSDGPALEAVAATPSGMPGADTPKRPLLDPNALFPQAKSMALAWNADSLLVRIEVKAVRTGKVDAEAGGTVNFLFAPPQTKLAPGELVSKQRLVIMAQDSGLRSEEQVAKVGERGVADPACPFDEAWRKAVASGLPQEAALDMTYAYSNKHERSVWLVSAASEPKLSRTIDGWSCAVVVR